MARVFTGNMAERRACISLAALLVKVTAMMPAGETCPVCNNQAMRVVSTRVLPDPAPARIKAGPGGAVTAANCSGFNPASKGEVAPEATGEVKPGVALCSIIREF